MKIIRSFAICSQPESNTGYIGWPTIAKMTDGTLVVVSSCHRHTHIDAWGRTGLWKSHDNGQTWSQVEHINNTPLDDRDAGIIALPGNRMAVTWFSSDMKAWVDENIGWFKDWYLTTAKCSEEDWNSMMKNLEAIDPEFRTQYAGSWLRVSSDGEAWNGARRLPVSSPHGFIVLQDGSWLFLGKKWDFKSNNLPDANTPIVAARSIDEGRNWAILGTVPLAAGLTNDQAHEPYAIQLQDGSLLGAVRIHDDFRTYFTKSLDGGMTWETVHSPVDGAPPHLLQLSNGKIICVNSIRTEPYGILAYVSDDNGCTWSPRLTIRDDGPDSDLGYPSSVELPGGHILTVYYMKEKAGRCTSLLGTEWEL